jgi:hypothetical protein
LFLPPNWQFGKPFFSGLGLGRGIKSLRMVSIAIEKDHDLMPFAHASKRHPPVRRNLANADRSL